MISLQVKIDHMQAMFDETNAAFQVKMSVTPPTEESIAEATRLADILLDIGDSLRDTRGYQRQVFYNMIRRLSAGDAISK